MLLEVEKLNGLLFRVLMHSLNWICPALWQKCDLHSWSSITGPVLLDFARLERIHLMPLKISVLPKIAGISYLKQGGCVQHRVQGGSFGTPRCPLTPNPLRALWWFTFTQWMSRSAHTHCSSIIPFPLLLIATGLPPSSEFSLRI